VRKMSTDGAATLGQVSAIMLGINTGATVALKLGSATSVDVEQEAAFYRGVLQEIINSSARAEKLYQEWINDHGGNR
jgi:hypothetical protein